MLNQSIDKRANCGLKVLAIVKDHYTHINKQTLGIITKVCLRSKG